ncbi:MAG: hypothetical protein HY727_01305 [Candidatus Rokubacteria bacterium]|nr:hypothetical protein [Candidatus Rokubacteria bacterium]
MIVVSHRVNTIEQLAQTSTRYGVEVDLRDYNGKVVVQHDPGLGGETFERYIEHFRHRFIILNVKCEGIEAEVLRIVERRGIEDFFFLDLSFPALVKLVRQGERRIAVRFSEHEPIEGCLALAGKVDWIWVDCFSDFPAVLPERERVLSEFKTCLVAPELQGRAPLDPAPALAIVERYQASAVCTKHVEAWAALCE